MHQETQLTGDTPEKTESNKGLEKAEQELASLLARKKELDKQLISVEHSIYALESAYLSETSGFGNIITGFDSYLTGRASDKRRTRIEIGRAHV